jgi:hypothetical protein
MDRSRLSTRPRFLFGDFWLEGEVAILFSDAGSSAADPAAVVAASCRHSLST